MNRHAIGDIVLLAASSVTLHFHQRSLNSPAPIIISLVRFISGVSELLLWQIVNNLLIPSSWLADSDLVTVPLGLPPFSTSQGLVLSLVGSQNALVQLPKILSGEDEGV